MLPAEQEPIRLPPIVSETVTTEGLSVHFQSGRRIIVPHRFGQLWDQVKAGGSLYSLCVCQRTQTAHSTVFIEVARFLHFLVDRDLVEDLRLVRLSDAIRGEYEWPESLIAFFSPDDRAEPLWLWGRRHRASLALGRAVDLPLAFLAVVGLGITLVVGFSLFARPFSVSPLAVILAWGASGVLARSGMALVRLAASRINGDAGELRWLVDLMGPSLIFRPITLSGPFRRAVDFFAVFIIPVFVLVLTLAFSSVRTLAASEMTFILAYSWLVTAFSAHPRLRSAVTDSLRVWNRTPLAYDEHDEMTEIERFHQFAGAGSIGLAVCAFGFLGFARSPNGWLTVLSAVVIALLALSYVEPFFVQESAGRNLRRRRWARSPKPLEMAAVDREAWAGLPVLRQLTTPLRKRLLAGARSITVARGQAVCRQGGVDRSLYVVLSGQVAVAKSFDGRRRKVVAMLSSGAVFGETAFFFGKPRTADVVAMEDSTLIEIRYHESMRDLDLASSDEFQFRVWLLQALSGQGFLKDLPSEAMDTLIFAGQRRHFKAGEAIFTEGAPGDACYFIAQGQAAAVKGGAKIREMGAGDAFGEIALLRPHLMRTATVVAESDLLCMELTVDSFWSTLSSRLPLGVEIERLAARRLQSDQQRGRF